ncbi:MAG: Swt1 family HEPN domain-containing protein [Candidatus Bathyarchaeia archaeon]
MVEVTEYFLTFVPKYHTPPPFPIQIDTQIEKEAENMRNCYHWLYIFENTLRNFIHNCLLERYGEKWFEELSQRVKKEIEENKKRWRGGIQPRTPLEFTTLPTLSNILMSKWSDVFQDKFKNTNPTSLKESLNKIEGFRNTIAHNRMLTEDESKVFYYEVKSVLSSLEIKKVQIPRV